MRPWHIAALTLIALPVVAAQGAPQAALVLDVPPGPTGVDLGSTHEVPFTVTFTLSGVVCASPAQAKVPITVADKPSPLAGVEGTPRPAELVFEIPAGSYASSAYSKEATAGLAVRVASDAPSGHEHALVLTASYAGGVPAGCQGTGVIPATEATGEHKIMTRGPMGGSTVPTHQMTDGSTMQGDAMPAKKQTPGPAIILVALAIVGAALSRRR